jgi:hypothetical protein
MVLRSIRKKALKKLKFNWSKRKEGSTEKRKGELGAAKAREKGRMAWVTCT